MAQPTPSSPAEDYHPAPVSSLRTRFEQLAAAQAGPSTAPSSSIGSGGTLERSARGRLPIPAQFGSTSSTSTPATSPSTAPPSAVGPAPSAASGRTLGVSEFGETGLRVRAKSNPPGPPPIPAHKPLANGGTYGNGTPRIGGAGAASEGIVAPTPRKQGEVRGSPSSPDLSTAYRRDGLLEPSVGGTASEGSTPVPGDRPALPGRPLSRRGARTPTDGTMLGEQKPALRTPAPSPPRVRTPAPAPPPPRSRTPAPPTATPMQSTPSAPATMAALPITSVASTSTVPTVVVDSAALARKPPPPPPPVRPRTSGDPLAQLPSHSPAPASAIPDTNQPSQNPTPTQNPKYMALPPRSPSGRSLSPVPRSSSAPSITFPRPIPIPSGGLPLPAFAPQNVNGASLSEPPQGMLEHQGQYTESPPPLPARPGLSPSSASASLVAQAAVDELGRPRPALPGASPSSATLPLRHRPTVSTSAVPSPHRGPPVPPRPATGNKLSPILRPDPASTAGAQAVERLALGEPREARPPLPIRPKLSPVSSGEGAASVGSLGLAVSSSVTATSSPNTGMTTQGSAPPLPLRKLAPLPVSTSLSSQPLQGQSQTQSLSPESTVPVPSLPRLARSVPPAHPAFGLEKRQASLNLSDSISPPLPLSSAPILGGTFSPPLPPPPAPPSRSLDSQQQQQPPAPLQLRPIPSSPLPPHLPPPTRSVTIPPPPSHAPPKREKSGDSDSEDDDDYSPGGSSEALSPPMAGVLPVPSPTPGAGLRRGVEDLPDATNSNRRPPHLFPDHRSLPARSHMNQYPVMAMAGSFVVVGNWTVAVYNIDEAKLNGGEPKPTMNISLDDTGLEWRIKEPRVTAMEFRPGVIREEEGRYLWCGTKDGHLWELDVWTGLVTETRAQAHSSGVMHIFRWGRSMVTVEESGKMFVFDCDDASGRNAPRMSGNYRFVRIGEKQTFARCLGKLGQVWTSEGAGTGTVGGAKSLSSTPTRGPAIRVYDIRAPEQGGAAYRTIVCPEPLGAVTAACILPTQPEVIYLGHEGGCLSLWTRTDEEPRFIKSVKVGPSDILTMEGVMNRLWIGNRQGIIAAYDVAPWPWKVTNMWKAHGDSPITRLMVDVVGIERNQRLAVLSVGKDERAKLWDGLLAYHWINDELLKREEQFSTFRPINVLLCTWNVDAAKPEMLTGTPENATFFEQVLHSVNAPDIIVFSFQELVDLESRKLTAKTVLLGGSKRTDGGLSDKISSRYRLWYEKLISAVRIAMPPEQPYVPILTENLVGLFTCVFVRASEKADFKDVHITTVKRGMAGMYGNKGAIVARFTVDDSSLCFINCHLAAGQRHVRERNTDVAAVMEDKSLLPESEIEDDDNLAYGGGGDGSMALDHEICFLNGDLNYRIDQRRDAVIANITKENYIDLLPYDQLQKELNNNPGFRLRGFSEAPITFKPTYKYDKRTDEYDSSGKQRTPAWCDRILFRCRDPWRIEPLAYKRLEPNISDHRPVVGVFKVTVKSLTHELRHQVKQQLQDEWKVEESKNLSLALDAYRQQGLLS